MSPTSPTDTQEGAAPAPGVPAAPPGSKVSGAPSVKAAWFADVRRAGSVGRNVFWPAPNVDSGLVAWTRREPPTTAVDRQTVFAVVDAAFAQRRKALRPALRGIAGSADVAEEALREAGVDPMTRGEQLEIGDFVRIAEALAARTTATIDNSRGHNPKVAGPRLTTRRGDG